MVNTMDSNKYVHKNDKTASRIIDGQAVIMTLEDNTLHTLNDTGSRIWELCDGQRTIGDIAKVIHDGYMIDYDEGRKHCESFVQDLCGKGMLVLQGTGCKGKRINQQNGVIEKD